MYNRFYPLFCSLLLIMLLSGCEFQLQGYNQILPFHTLYLESNPPYTNFSKELRQALKTMEVNVCLSPPAPLTLQILSQNFTRTMTSLGNVGQTTTYLISFTVLFQLFDRANHILLPPQQVRAMRNFSITSNQLSGDLNTQTDLEKEMQRDAIQQLLTRLASLTLPHTLCQTYSPSR